MTVPVEDSIGAMLQDVLNSVVSTFEQAAVPLPSKQFITVGQIAHDCEQVVVGFIQMYIGPPGVQSELPQRCNAPRTVVMEVQIVRQLPIAQARQVLSDAAYNDMAMKQMRDAWLMMDAATQTFDALAGVIADVSVTNPEGGYQAVILNLVAAVP